MNIEKKILSIEKCKGISARLPYLSRKGKKGTKKKRIKRSGIF